MMQDPVLLENFDRTRTSCAGLERNQWSVLRQSIRTANLMTHLRPEKYLQQFPKLRVGNPSATKRTPSALRFWLDTVAMLSMVFESEMVMSFFGVTDTCGVFVMAT